MPPLAPLPAFDVFFQPSHWEAMSIAILEAMAAGKAIVATRVGDNGRVLEHGVTGLLEDPRDVEGMSATLIRLAGDQALRQRLGRGGRREVRRAVHTRPHDPRLREDLSRGPGPSRRLTMPPTAIRPVDANPDRAGAGWPPAVIAGAYQTGVLGVRSLTRRGVRAVCFDCNPRNPGFRSVYGPAQVVPQSGCRTPTAGCGS